MDAWNISMAVEGEGRGGEGAEGREVKEGREGGELHPPSM